MAGALAAAEALSCLTSVDNIFKLHVPEH
eukprot:COSAG02_NODE_12325_length_1561_cov_25.880723_3_plen_28_part_01